MPNELLLVISIFVFFGLNIIWLILFGERGLVCWTVIATITANIEVLILVEAFGFTQTLGNVMFASTFLTTDILSELYGKKSAQRAVNVGIAASVSFITISQLWLLFTPAASDWAFSSIIVIFKGTPRIMLTGLIVYAVSQRLDVWLYHKWWNFTKIKFGSKIKYLWLRNNGSTLISQLINTVLFTIGAFYGARGYDNASLVSIAAAAYIVFIATTIADTPFIYLARILKEKNYVNIFKNG